MTQLLRASRNTRPTRHSVGADILLARHGSAITSLRVDKTRGQVVARLLDGTFDTAPNLIDPELHMYGNDDAALVRVAAASTVFSAVGLTALVAAIYTLAGPENMNSLATIMGSYTPGL